MNGGIKVQRHMVDFLFTLALFCVFAATALMVVIIGARVYRDTVDNMDINFERRTSLSYVSTKIRQFDTAGGVALGEFGGVPALILTQEIGGNVFNTLIYHYDGSLRELSIRAGADSSPENGAVVMSIKGFAVEEASPGLYRLISTDSDGSRSEVMVSVQCG